MVAFGIIWLGAALVAALVELPILLLSELELELELSVLELMALVLAGLATDVDDVGLVPPLPPPQAASAKPKKLAIKRVLVDLIVVSGRGIAVLFSCFEFLL